MGGVLEHPAWSDAWPAFRLTAPPAHGGWVRADWLDGFDGWTCHVEQSRYGHRAKKATWLYACGVELPELDWGSVPDAASLAWVSWCGNHVRSRGKVERLGKRERNATPPAFRDLLLSIARSAKLCSESLRMEST